MIKIKDASVLAFAKLRTHKIRTLIAILLSSLLFSILIISISVIQGTFNSIDNFRKGELTSRYIVSVSNAPIDRSKGQDDFNDPVLIEKAKKRYTALVKEKTLEAKKLGIEYLQASDQPPYQQTLGGAVELSLNDPNDIVYEVLKEKYKNIPAFDDSKLNTIAKEYNASKIFSDEFYSIKRGSSLISLKDRKELFYDKTNEKETNANYIRPFVDESSIILGASEIIDSFILPNNAGWQPDSKSLPIVLPQNVIEQLLGMEKITSDASFEEKLSRLKKIRENITNLTFKMCYRNDVSSSQIQKAITQKKEIEANKDKKDYQKPKLIYNLPDASSCANAVIASDTRTKEEKLQDSKQKLFDEKFGKNTSPVSKFITFKVVGMSPSGKDVLNPQQKQQEEKARTFKDIINGILKPSDIGQMIPKKLYDELTNKEDYADLFTYKPFYMMGNEDNKRRFVEFKNADDAQKFINEKSCVVQYDNTCKPFGNPYQASLMFSNSSALDDAQNTILGWLIYLIVAIAFLATIIMWFMISRIIADSRHETAVFRAIGFKRIDITFIYLLYVFMLTILIMMFALLFGVIGTFLVNAQFSTNLTVQAQYVFGDFGLNKQVSLVCFDCQKIALVLMLIFSISLISIIVPLYRNVRRSPIKDLKEE